eukprot:scaffold4127_cov126-Cylindrotheca_fusiformis.AAC.5
MKLSIAVFLTWLLLVQSQDGRSQSSLLRQEGAGSAAGNPSSPFENFEDATPSIHRSLQTSYWELVAALDQLEDSLLDGYRVSISGDGSILAAAPLFYIENSAGGIRFFQKQDGAWKENTDLRLLGVADDDYVGSDVSLSWSGQRVAIGAYGDSGIVSIYEMSDGTWGEPLQVIHGEAAGDQSFQAVALSKDGKTLAIGARYNDGSGNFISGDVRVYRWDADTSLFKQMGEDIDGEAAGEGSCWKVPTKTKQCGYGVVTN